MFSEPELNLNLYFIDMGKCIFNREWPIWYPWVKQMDSKLKAHCHACNLEEGPDFDSQTANTTDTEEQCLNSRICVKIIHQLVLKNLKTCP